MTTRIRASAVDMEMALIACAILSPQSIVHADQDVNWQDFGDTSLGRLWSLLRTGHGMGVQLDDVVSLLDYLRKANAEEQFLSPLFWAGVIQDGTPANVKWYAKQVRKESMLRRTAITCQNIVHQCSLPGADPECIIAETIAKLGGIGNYSGDHTMSLGAACDHVLRMLAEGKDAGRGSFTGLHSFDSTCGAMMPSELVILAARPGVGKTSLAMQIARHNAAKQRRVLFVSLEMSVTELATRLMCADSRISSRSLRQPKVPQAYLDRLSNSRAVLSPLPIEIFAPPTASVDQIKTVAKVAADKNSDLRLVVVDYIGIVQPADYKEPRHEQVGRISRSLKALAKEIDVPVLALCQLNREADAARPRLSFLRDSGSIEQDADVVMFLHREPSANKDDVGLYVEKHRHAEATNAMLRFVPHETRFVDPSFAVSVDCETGRHDAFDSFNSAGAF